MACTGKGRPNVYFLTVYGYPAAQEHQVAAQGNQGRLFRQNSNRGRKSIPFDRRNEQQHQGRMAYLLKKIGEGSDSQWNQDLIVDLQAYCTRYQDFYKEAIEIYGAPEIDLDTLIAMLQSH